MIVSSEFWELFCWLCCNDGSIFLNFDIHVWFFLNIVRVNVNLWNGSPINVIDVNNLVFDVFGWLQLSPHCSRILFTVKIIISTFWLVTFQRRFKVWNKLKCFLLVTRKISSQNLISWEYFYANLGRRLASNISLLKCLALVFSKAVFQPIKFCNFGL